MADDAFPIITVEDLSVATSFYQQLGFTQNYAFPPDGEPVFVTLERDGSTIGISSDRAGPDRFAYWLYVPDVDETFDAVVARGAEVVSAPEDQPWGERVASVRDPDGNLIHLGANSGAA